MFKKLYVSSILAKVKTYYLANIYQFQLEPRRVLKIEGLLCEYRTVYHPVYSIILAQKELKKIRKSEKGRY